MEHGFFDNLADENSIVYPKFCLIEVATSFKVTLSKTTFEENHPVISSESTTTRLDTLVLLFTSTPWFLISIACLVILSATSTFPLKTLTFTKPLAPPCSITKAVPSTVVFKPPSVSTVNGLDESCATLKKTLPPSSEILLPLVKCSEYFI